MIDAPLQLWFQADYDDYIEDCQAGTKEPWWKDQQAVICKRDGSVQNVRITSLMVGLKRVDTESATVGDIVAVSGISDITIAKPYAA